MSPTPPKPKDVLLETAAQLSRAAPNRWDDFVKAFEVFTDERASACVHVGADKILNAQGKAQQLVELSDLFATATKPK